MTHQPLEWQFFDTDAETEWPPQTMPAQLVAQDPGQNIEGIPQPSSKAHYRYELICGVALLYGITLYLLWQQGAQRIAVLESEVAAVRGEVATLRQNGAEDAAATTNGNSDSGAVETTYLHFTANQETMGTVKRIAWRVDATYQQLHQDFNASLPVAGEKLSISVLPVIRAREPVMRGYDPRTEEQLIVVHPKFAAERYGISEEEALTTELLVRLALRLVERAISSRPIKPQWQGMVLALKTEVQLDHGYNASWQWNDTLLLHRYNAQCYSLDLVHDLTFSERQTDYGPSVSPIAYATANPLVEFILVTYGYDKVPALLDAFAKHETWETLTPALFHLSADEFEAQWHAYLRKHYPIPG